jgi:hypothetical protein
LYLHRAGVFHRENLSPPFTRTRAARRAEMALDEKALERMKAKN